MSSKNRRKRKKTITLLAIVVVIAVIVIAANYRRQTGDKIAATVNGEKILKEDVLREYLNVPPEYKQVVTVDSILRGMIIEKLILQEASKKGITVSEEEIDSFIDGLLDSYGLTEENLTKSLEENDITLDDLRNSYKERLAMSKLLNQTVLSEISVSEREMQSYYAENFGQFTTPERARASHILVNTSKEATSIRNKALGGMSFAELAEKYSTCPSSADGGDLGWFTRGQMVKEFEDAAFSLELGEISPVVETQFGFHVIKLTDRSEVSRQSFDEAKEQIGQTLLDQKQRYAVDIYTAQLEAAADIKIFMTEKKEPEGTPISEIIRQQKAEEEAEAASEVTTTEAEEETGEGIVIEEIEEETAEYSSLAVCLASKGAKMYGSETSSTSNKQKELFGDDFSDIDYIDCSSQKDTCKDAGVISYPTWVIKGKKYPGKYSLERLAELSGC